MGDAKRRKQKLGDAYGKTPPVLMLGSRQLEKHIEKFFEDWTQKADSLWLPEDDSATPLSSEEMPSQAEVIEKLEDMNQWIDDYLQPYRPQDREKLACAVLDVQYAAIKEAEGISEEETADFTMQWIMQTLSLFRIFKPYLSTARTKCYAEPLHSFYNMIMEEAETQEEGSEEFLTIIKDLFEACLGESVGQKS